MAAPWYSLSQRLLQMNNIQQPQPEEYMVTMEPGCLSMWIWATAPGKPPISEEAEAKCEGNLKHILSEKHDEYQWWT